MKREKIFSQFFPHQNKENVRKFKNEHRDPGIPCCLCTILLFYKSRRGYKRYAHPLTCIFNLPIAVGYNDFSNIFLFLGNRSDTLTLRLYMFVIHGKVGSGVMLAT